MIESLEKECWGLDTSLAELILPRLLYFKNWMDRYGTPMGLEEDEWEEILDELVWTFTFISQDYPSRALDYIENVDFGPEDNVDSEGNIVTKSITITYSDEEQYNIEKEIDKANIARAKAGLKLFAEYYMDLWD